MNSTETTRTVLDRYVNDLYHGRKLELIPQLLADPMLRHEAGGETRTMTLADCEARIGGFFNAYRALRFEAIHIVVEGEFASWTYNGYLEPFEGEHQVISGIEVFRVSGGKIVEVWNPPSASGAWG